MTGKMTHMMLIRHAHFLVYNLVKVLLIIVTPAMVVHDASITQSYALTIQAETGEKHQFCALLKDTINKIKKKESVIVMGDLNATVGADTGGLKQVKGMD